MRAELERLRERYTDAHPRVRALRDQLDRLNALERQGRVSSAPQEWEHGHGPDRLLRALDGQRPSDERPAPDRPGRKPGAVR